VLDSYDHWYASITYWYATIRIRHSDGHRIYTRSRAAKEVYKEWAARLVFMDRRSTSPRKSKALPNYARPKADLQLATNALHLGISDTDLLTGATIWNPNCFRSSAMIRPFIPTIWHRQIRRDRIWKDDLEQIDRFRLSGFADVTPNRTRFRLVPRDGVTRTLKPIFCRSKTIAAQQSA